MVKVKALKIGLEMLMGWRKVTLAYFFASMAVILFTASVFSALIYNMLVFNQTGQITLDFFNLVVSSVGILSILFLAWCLNERRWLSAFNIEQQIVNLSSMDKIREQPQSILDEKTITDLIEKVLDKKLESLIDEQLKKSQDSKSSESLPHIRSVHGSA